MKLQAGRPSQKKKAKEIEDLKEDQIKTTFSLPKSKMKKLKVYSLENDMTMRQAILSFIDSLK